MTPSKSWAADKQPSSRSAAATRLASPSGFRLPPAAVPGTFSAPSPLAVMAGVSFRRQGLVSSAATDADSSSNRETCAKCGRVPQREAVFSGGRLWCLDCYDVEAQPQLPLPLTTEGGRRG